MGIESKHSYRFVYLKSEKWKDVRIEAMRRDEALCRICAERSIENDAHHIYYPESVWDTCPDDLVILCRPCHNLVEKLFTLTRDKQKNLQQLKEFVEILRTWRFEKINAESIDVSDEYKFLRKIVPLEKSKRCVVCKHAGESVRLVELTSIMDKPLMSPQKYTLWPLCANCASDFKAEFIANPPKNKLMTHVAAWKNNLRKKLLAENLSLTMIP